RVRDAELKALAGLCAKCGTCRTVCTLYPERKAEIAVARGKIALIDAAMSGEDDDAEAVQEALTDCLLCGRCERACPNQVLVEEIVMKGRSDLAEVVGIPAWKRVLFGKMMTSPSATGIARKGAAAAQRLLPGKIPTASGLHYRFPEGFGGGGRTVPKLPSKGFLESLGKAEAATGEVMLFIGCVFDHVFPKVGRAAYETVKASGKSVAVFRDAACCGLPAMVSGDRRSATSSAGANVRRLREAEPGAIVFPCGSCLLMFKRNVFSLIPKGAPGYDDAVYVAERAVDYASFLLSSGVLDRIPDPPPGQKVGEIGYHDPCHLSGTLGKGPEAREVLSRTAGPAFAEMAGADLCCGYGGTFNVRDYPTSSRIGESKVTAAARGGTKVISTACSGCVLQMRDMAARTDPTLRVVHIAELVHQALFRK
ncbi:(Fe-S)-binding protein, partial [Candidatus Deferrimicrobium sp.]|uniref:(Fe-S)-binding protein n=1 Tax=Candidatus Deferrimicrobium sp. TaxID=3060586 RepID=UPI002ED7A77F